MSDVFSDAQLRRALKRIPKTQPRSLWQEADSIAVYLALTGSFDAALRIWRFLFAELPERSDATRLLITAIPEALCHLAQIPNFFDGEEELASRVRDNEMHSRHDITMDMWNPDPKLEPPQLKNIRRARALALPLGNSRYSKTELESLPFLEAFLSDAGIAFFAVPDAHLLFADIACRHNRREMAIEHLTSWGRITQKRAYSAWHAFALPEVAQLISENHLEFLTKMSRAERVEIAQQTVAAVRERLNQDTEKVSKQTVISTAIFHSFFSLQPATYDAAHGNETYFDTLQTPPHIYPVDVSVAAPSETGSATFRLRFSNTLPNLEIGVFAATFPFRALENPARGALNSRVGNVFLGSIDEGGDVGFEVPPGDYDVAAIFTRGVGEKEDEAVGLRHFEVDLCFLPRGTYEAFGPVFDRSWDTD